MVSLLRYVCKELEERGIEYMVSGSFAMTAYTTPRFTRDIDIVIQLNKENLESFSEIFSGNYYFHKPSVEEEISRQGMFNIIDFESGAKVDFIILKHDIYRELEFTRKSRHIISDVEAWVVSLEDLVISKLIWANQMFSSQQILDIENLIDSPELDREYVKLWCKKLRLDTFKLI